VQVLRRSRIVGSESRVGAPHARPRCHATSRVLLACLVVSAIALVVPQGARAGAVSSLTPVILDTDFYSGPDSVGGEAALLALELRSEVQVIAMGVNTRFNRPQVATDSWKCMAAIAQFYGYPNIPIGSDMPDNGPPPSSFNFIGPCAALASPHTPQPLPAVELYRKALAAQPDGSVVFVETGYEENLQSLLNSSPDSISPLNGAQLVAQKVQTLVVMGGGYPSSVGENNFQGNAGAASFVATNWPTKIVYSGYEVGANVITGHTVSSVHPANSPVRVAMEAFGGVNKSITSFDLTAIYHAIRPTDASLTEVGPGTNAIGTYGANTFTLGTGDQYYLSLTNQTALEASIETLWDTLPGTAPQTIAFTSTPPPAPTVDGSYAASAVGGTSGNPVTLSIDPTSTSGCTINSSGNVYFGAPLGTCIVDANQPGSTTYAPAVAQQTINVAGLSQTILFTSTAPTSPTIGATYDVAAVGGASLNPVTFSVDASSTSGCTVDGAGTVTFLAPPGACVVDANELGNTTYAPATQAQQTINVTGLAQTISFTSIAPTSASVGGTPYKPQATATSGLAVSFVLDSISKGCTLASGTVRFAEVGTCVIDATQGGSGSYLAAPMQQQSIAVGKGASVITITSAAPKSPKAGGSYTPVATSNSGDAVRLALGAYSAGCRLAHGVVEFRTIGTCVVDFIDAGNANYERAYTQHQTLATARGRLQVVVGVSPTTAKSGATITLTAHVSVPFATGTIRFTAHSTTLCTATFKGGVARCNAATHLPKGTYAVFATYSGSSSFYAATVRTTVRFT